MFVVGEEVEGFFVRQCGSFRLGFSTTNTEQNKAPETLNPNPDLLLPELVPACTSVRMSPNLNELKQLKPPTFT